MITDRPQQAYPWLGSVRSSSVVLSRFPKDLVWCRLASGKIMNDICYMCMDIYIYVITQCIHTILCMCINIYIYIYTYICISASLIHTYIYIVYIYRVVYVVSLCNITHMFDPSSSLNMPKIFTEGRATEKNRFQIILGLAWRSRDEGAMNRAMGNRWEKLRGSWGYPLVNIQIAMGNHHF